MNQKGYRDDPNTPDHHPATTDRDDKRRKKTDPKPTTGHLKVNVLIQPLDT